jgi:hypothetical protein
MNNFTFALPSGYDWDIKKFAKQVKTKKFVKTYEGKLGKYADKLTNANRDDVQIIGGMLQAAYGANIGRQVESLLSEKDFTKIRSNILNVFYGMNV